MPDTTPQALTPEELTPNKPMTDAELGGVRWFAEAACRPTVNQTFRLLATIAAKDAEIATTKQQFTETVERMADDSATLKAERDAEYARAEDWHRVADARSGEIHRVTAERDALKEASASLQAEVYRLTSILIETETAFNNGLPVLAEDIIYEAVHTTEEKSND